jgi:ClpP class serine protease
MDTNDHRRPVPRVIDALCHVHWMMPPEHLSGLIDIVQRVNTPDYAAVEARRAQRAQRREWAAQFSDVAVLEVFGPIVPRASMFSDISGATSIEELNSQLDLAISNPEIRGVMFAIDSPGGAASGVDAFADKVHRLRGTKPIVAAVTGMAASAAYWIAAAAHEIVASPAAMLGSVGVVASIRKRSDDTVEIVSSQSPNKRPDVSTPEGRAPMQEVVDALADVFIDSVTTYRGITRANVIEGFGRGGMRVGAQAVAVGMADAVGSLEDAVERIRAGKAAAGRVAPTAEKAAAAARVAAAAAGLMKEHPDRALEARWLADDNLRREFGTFQTFKAYATAYASGRVTLIRNRTVTGKPGGLRPL